MAGRDGNGPLGQGARTGRGMGPCSADNNSPNDAPNNSFFGFGRGNGAGRGRGMGLGNMRFWNRGNPNTNQDGKKD